VEREKAEVGALIALEEPTRAMRTEAAGAGFYPSPLGRSRHPRIQLLTIESLLQRKEIDLPRSRVEVTFRNAPRVQATRKQRSLDHLSSD
jgi:site-specific DNA-methyltransferase (adenine-specific)